MTPSNQAINPLQGLADAVTRHVAHVLGYRLAGRVGIAQYCIREEVLAFADVPGAADAGRYADTRARVRAGTMAADWALAEIVLRCVQRILAGGEERKEAAVGAEGIGHSTGR